MQFNLSYFIRQSQNANLQLLLQKLLDSQSTGKSCMALTQCGHCFQSFVLLRAEISGTSHWTTTHDKGFLALAPIQAPLPTSFSSFKTWSFAYSFCSSLAYHSTFFHVAYIAVLHCTTHVQYFLFTKFLVTFLPQCILCWSIANKHILFNRKHLFIIHNYLSLSNTKHNSASLVAVYVLERLVQHHDIPTLH
jgi:hypothetical protein